MTWSGMNEASAPEHHVAHPVRDLVVGVHTTGAGYAAFTTVPSGASTSTGRHAPELGGTTPAESTAILSAVNTPDAVTESGAFIGPATCAVGACEIDRQAVAALDHPQPDVERLVLVRSGSEDPVPVAIVLE